MADMSTEERLRRLEELADRLIALAREHRAGRMILFRLGIR
jgi:hypothetical protein